MKQGWEIKKLGEVCTFCSGYTPKENEFKKCATIPVPYFKVSDMNHLENHKYLTYTTLYLENGCKTYPKHTIVFPKNGAAIATNKKRLLGQDSVVDLNTGGVIANDKIVFYEYLYLFLLNLDFRLFTRRGAVPTLDIAELKKQTIPVPPLPIQEQIVSELDLLSGIIEKKREQLKELDALAQSIFYDMFGDPITNEKGWEVKKLGEVCKVNPSKKDTSIGLSNSDIVSFLPMEDLPIKACYHSPKQTRLFSEVQSSYTCFANNDVLMAKVTPCFENGKIGIASNLMNGIGYGSSEFIVIRANNIDVIKEYPYFVIQNTSFIENACAQLTGTSGLRRVPRQYVENCNISIPPLPLQHQFATKIEAIEKQKELIKQSISETETLFNERMQEHFG